MEIDPGGFDMGPGDFDPGGFDAGPGDFDSGFDSAPVFDDTPVEDPGMPEMDVLDDVPVEEVPTDLNDFESPVEIPDSEPTWNTEVPAIEPPPIETADPNQPDAFEDPADFQIDTIPPEVVIPEISDQPDLIDEPESTDQPDSIVVPELSDEPLPEEIPVDNDQAVPEETPVYTDQPLPEESPVDIDQPLPEETPIETDQPLQEETPVDTDQPMPEETPVDTNQPLPEESPLDIDQPLPEEAQTDFDHPLPESDPSDVPLDPKIPDGEAVEFQSEGEPAFIGPEETEIYHSPETTDEIGPGIGPNPSWDQAPDTTTDGMPSENELNSDQTPQSDSYGTPDLPDSNKGDAIPDDNAPSVPDESGGDAVEFQGEGEPANVGPEQTEIYHSPDTTDEIEPGLGPNSSLDQAPDTTKDDIPPEIEEPQKIDGDDTHSTQIDQESGEDPGEEDSREPDFSPETEDKGAQDSTPSTDGEPSEEEMEDAETSEEENIEEENERKPINFKYANDIYSFENKNDELFEKYPEGVAFDADGYPDFSSYAIKTVEIDMKGNYTTDFKKANEAAGLEETPEGYTWHHNQDGKTMQLVPTDLHGAVRHSGGVSVLNQQ